MDYRGIFEDAVDTLRAEKRYRIFADLERVAGQFPRAIYRDESDNMRDITIWCSNDYLGMGQIKRLCVLTGKTRRRKTLQLTPSWAHSGFSVMVIRE